MFKPLGLLSHIPCPAHRNGSCEDARLACPFSHAPEAAPVHPPPTTPRTSTSSARAASPSHPQSAASSFRSAIKRTASDSSPTNARAGEASSAPQLKKARNAYAAKKADATANVASPAARDKGKAKADGTKAEDEDDGWTTVGTLKPPTLTFASHPPNSQISLSARQGSLKTFHATLSAIYSPLFANPSSAVRHVAQRLAHDHALAQELEVFKSANKFSYRNACVTTVVGIKKRDVEALRKASTSAARAAKDAEGHGAGSPERAAKAILDACTETGTNAQVGTKRAAAVGRAKGRLTRARLANAGFLCPKGDLEKWGYMVDIPQEWGPGGTKVSSVGETKKCDRCSKLFIVGGELDDDGTRKGQEPYACRYHWGRQRYEKPVGQESRTKVETWTCCGRPVASGALGPDTCSDGPHVFKEETPRELHEREGFVCSAVMGKLSTESTKTDEGNEGQRKGQGLDEGEALLEVAALDCELSFTAAGMSLTRLSVVDEEGKLVLDELVRPRAEMIDFNTRFSGINEENFQHAVMDLAAVRRALSRFVGPNTVLIGHGLENDLRALRILHTCVVDTAILFPHPRGAPYRLSLRQLTSRHLGRIIQSGDATKGHSSAEDAQMALELVRWKMVNEPGTGSGSAGNVGTTTAAKASTSASENGKQTDIAKGKTAAPVSPASGKTSSVAATARSALKMPERDI